MVEKQKVVPKPKFEVIQDPDGKFSWSLINEKGAVLMEAHGLELHEKAQEKILEVKATAAAAPVQETKAEAPK